MTNEQRQYITELCLLAAKELGEAAEGFRLDYDENGLEHLHDALEYVEKLNSLIASTQAP